MNSAISHIPVKIYVKVCELLKNANYLLSQFIDMCQNLSKNERHLMIGFFCDSMRSN